MKSFLMFKDRDFDPQQILIKRAKRPRDLERDSRLSLLQLLPWNEKDLVQDLGLEILLNAMSKDDVFLLEVAKVTFLSSLIDKETIEYRQQILRDCLANEQVIRDIYQITIDSIEGEKNSYWGIFGRYPGGILRKSVDTLELFSGMLKKLRLIADQSAGNFKSEGFKRLFEMLRSELSDDYFDQIDNHLEKLKLKDGVLISTELSLGSKGKNYVLHEAPEDTRNWFQKLFSTKPEGYTFEVSPRDEAGTKALSELRDQGINIVANALAQSMGHILNFFEAMRTELAFYIGCLNLHKRLLEKEVPICLPVAVDYGTKELSLTNLYDAALSLNSDKKVVGNNLETQGVDLFIITGANTGGKSTFIRSIGVAQLMMQAGMFVTADNFTAEIRNGIVTHFKREEDTAMESGKLDEELSRMSDIVDKISTKSMILFNESFSATNETEGSEIAKQVTNALLNIGIKVFFVTHQYEFAHSIYEMKMQNAFFLRAERLADGTRTFHLLEGKPLQTSYGRDLFKSIFQSRTT